MAIYLDCNATTPLDPAVAEAVVHFMTEEFGNAGSRTHEYGARTKQAVERARDQVAKVVAAKRDEVVFTSGATESDNLAILGLAHYGLATGKRHIVSSAIEHKAVLEPLEEMARRGFDVSLVNPTAGGGVDSDEVLSAVREDTLLVSVMAVNNETGVIQPIEQIASGLAGHCAFFHVDAAQGFGKLIDPLRSQRIDLISISGHKIYGPKGVGALVTRRRGFAKVPLEPLVHGGGQERGLRPGTLPVPLVVGLGLAAELAEKHHDERAAKCLEIRRRILEAFGPLCPVFNGDQGRVLYNTVNLRFPGVDSEAAIVALKDELAISNGSACTSASYEPSHVLKAMGLTDTEAQESLRLSWYHDTPSTNFTQAAACLRNLLR